MLVAGECELTGDNEVWNCGAHNAKRSMGKLPMESVFPKTRTNINKIRQSTDIKGQIKPIRGRHELFLR